VAWDRGYANFAEPPQGEVRRMSLPRTRVNKAKKSRAGLHRREQRGPGDCTESRFAPVQTAYPSGAIILPRGITRFLCTLRVFASFCT
jgi:hypothetical protein